MSYVILLNDLGRSDLSLAGGKGANLGAMISAGLPVPPGFCITTKAYERFVEINHLQECILRLLQNSRLNDPDALEIVSATIRSLFMEGTVPEDVAADIRVAYELAGNQIPVAVRSSATAEDLPDLSFAGQQDTYLNIQGTNALLQAVIRCWASLWTARAIGYRARNGIEQDHVALAVVVQQMVQSEASGVLFTSNPLTGHRLETVIDATVGLGEALVSGMVEPDHYVVDARAGGILKKSLGAKALSIRGMEGGGTHNVVENTALVQALPDAEILALAQLGQKAQAYFNAPQDVEWAWADRKLYLLQSRPITSLYPLPEGVSEEPCEVFFSFAAWQGMLDPFSPLGSEMFSGWVGGMARYFGWEGKPEDQRALVPAGERLYVNLTPLFKFKPGRGILSVFIPSIDPVSADAFENLVKDPRLGLEQEKLPLLLRLKIFRGIATIFSNVLRNLLNPRKRREEISRKIDLTVTKLQGQVEQVKTLGDLIDVIESTMISMPAILLPTLLPAVIAGQVPFQILLRALSKNPDHTKTIYELTRGLPHNVTTEMDLSLWKTSRVIGSDPAALEYFRTREASELTRAYHTGKLPPVAQQAIGQFLSIYGMRGVAEIDIYRPRWSDDPTHIFGVIKSYLEFKDTDLSPQVVFEQGAEKAHQSAEKLVDSIRQTPFGWVKAKLVGAAVFRVREFTGLRETPKFCIVRMLGMIRNGLVKIGHDLVQQGVLNEQDDIFFLHLRELRELADRQGILGIKELILQRRQVYQRELGRKRIPRLLLSDGVTIYETTTGVVDGQDSLKGSPVSAGVVEGVAHVVIDPHGAGLLPGEILVCPATDPAWTPLFLAAGGLVMEVGGMMTHGSVVAREYGIPAVVGVNQATSRIQSGQRIRVDGSTGIITVLPS